KSVAKPKASNGIIVNWATTAINTLLGALKTDLKSSSVSVNPIPNIMIPSKRATCGAIQEKPLGIKKLKTANRTTKIANVFPAKLLILSNVFTFHPPNSFFYYNQKIKYFNFNECSFNRSDEFSIYRYLNFRSVALTNKP